MAKCHNYASRLFNYPCSLVYPDFHLENWEKLIYKKKEFFSRVPFFCTRSIVLLQSFEDDAPDFRRSFQTFFDIFSAFLMTPRLRETSSPELGKVYQNLKIEFLRLRSLFLCGITNCKKYQSIICILTGFLQLP